MGSRFVPPDLAEHLDQSQISACLLMKVTPERDGFTIYGVTSLDVDVVYDDGDGVVTYLAAVGMDSSDLTATADLSPDDMEARSLMPVYDIPVSEEDIVAGMYDYAACKVMLVNFEDLTQGHVTLLEGTFGKVGVRDDGTSVVQEIRGQAAKLQQEICSKYTKTCRAIDGTQKIGSSTPGPQVKRDPCGIDFTVYLKSTTVSDVGLENTLTFRIDPDDIDSDWATANFFVPGRVTFTSGRNAGRTLEIMSSSTDGWITLRHEAGFAIEDGDGLDYRRGCSFIFDDADKGCLAHAGAERIDHFKGYPRIPTENEAQLMTPGATVGPGAGGGTSVPFPSDDPL